MKKGYMECPFCANEIKEGAKKCMYCKEYLDTETPKKTKKETLKEIKNIDTDDKKTTSKWWRFLVVLYFIITIPVLIGLGILIIGGMSEIGLTIPDNSSWGYHKEWIRNYYNIVFRAVIFIIIYILITNFIRRICSFIGKGKFNGFINYRNLFTKNRMLLVIIAVVLIGSFLLASHQKNKYNCGEGGILNDDLVCICDSKHGYKEVDGKCKKSEFYEIADAVRDYANERTSISLGYIYGVDMEKINDNEGLLLFVDTSVPGGSNPKEIDAIYGDFASCYEEVEGITSAVGQGYIVAFEKDGEKWIINDFYEIPWFETYKYSNSLQFSYPYLNLKQNNYTYYGGEKPTSDEDELLLEPSHVLNLRDLDGDGKSLEFLIINHFDLMCGINNYLALGYNPNTKKIVTYRFLDPQNHLHARTVLDSDAQNRFQGGILKMHDYGGHGVECDESREYIFNKDNNTFEAKNYKANKKCPY